MPGLQGQRRAGRLQEDTRFEAPFMGTLAGGPYILPHRAIALAVAGGPRPADRLPADRGPGRGAQRRPAAARCGADVGPPRRCRPGAGLRPALHGRGRADPARHPGRRALPAARARRAGRHALGAPRPPAAPRHTRHGPEGAGAGPGRLLAGPDSLAGGGRGHRPAAGPPRTSGHGASRLPAGPLARSRVRDEAGAVTAGAVAANLGGVALFGLPGLGLAELFAALRRLSLPRRLGYAYLLGVLAVGGALFAASHLLGVPLRRPVIAAAAVLAAALGLAAWAWRRRSQGPEPRARLLGPSPQGRRPYLLIHLLASLAVAAICLGPLTSALTAPLADWDGRMTWSPLASYLRHEGTVDAVVLRDARWWVLHPRYPPLLPLAQAAVQEAFGEI